MTITSLKNDRVKKLLLLQSKKRERQREGLFVVEGVKEAKMALQSGYKLKEYYFNKELMKSDDIVFFEKLEAMSFEVNRMVYNKIAYRADSQGLVALFMTKNKELENIPVKKEMLILVLEGIEKPGNVGAMMRSCDAVGADAIIIIDENFDLYNPNLIRSSVGCFFTQTAVSVNEEEALKWLKQNEVEIVAAAIQTKHFYHQYAFKQKTAIVMGTEAEGLRDFWIKNADAVVKIPMLGANDSLNVSVSAAVLMYESQRQTGAF